MTYRIIEKQKGENFSFYIQYNFMNKWLYCYEPITFRFCISTILLLTSISTLFIHSQDLIRILISAFSLSALLTIKLMAMEDDIHIIPKRIRFVSLYGAKEHIKEKIKIKNKPVKNTKIHYLNNTQLRMLKLKKLNK